MVLVWTQIRGTISLLQLVFGLTHPNLSMYLQFGIWLIVETFWHDSLERVSIPSAEEIRGHIAAMGARNSLLGDCWAKMDGLKLYLQQAGNSTMQERFYNR